MLTAFIDKAFTAVGQVIDATRNAEDTATIPFCVVKYRFLYNSDQVGLWIDVGNHATLEIKTVFELVAPESIKTLVLTASYVYRSKHSNGIKKISQPLARDG